MLYLDVFRVILLACYRRDYNNIYLLHMGERYTNSVISNLIVNAPSSLQLNLDTYCMIHIGAIASQPYSIFKCVTFSTCNRAISYINGEFHQDIPHEISPTYLYFDCKARRINSGEHLLHVMLVSYFCDCNSFRCGAFVVTFLMDLNEKRQKSMIMSLLIF